MFTNCTFITAHGWNKHSEVELGMQNGRYMISYARSLLRVSDINVQMYRYLNAILAQLKNSHLGLIVLLSLKDITATSDRPAHFLVKTNPAKCHY